MNVTTGFPLFVKACQFASDKHKLQKRKNKLGTPYINHPLEVANFISEVGRINYPIPLVAAVLHDTVEDTDATLEEIERLFGSDIAKIVAEVTDDKSLPKVERKRLQLEHSKIISYPAKLVKMADKISNLKDTVLDPPNWSVETQLGYAVWSKSIIDNMSGTNANLEKLFYYWFEKLLGQLGMNEKKLDYDQILEDYYQSMS